MPIVEPGPIWEVDFGHDHAKTEFSHGLDWVRPFGFGRRVSADAYT
jgi:hypothetical protein